MKYEWRKLDKKLYQGPKTPVVIEHPVQSFIMLNGQGNPNKADFSERVSALYSLAYAIKMEYKNAHHQEFIDFTVYPLEGIWQQTEAETLVKDDLVYTIMIAQPEFITNEMVETALEKVKVKKPNPFYNEIRFERISEGSSVTMLHVGPFDDEPQTFAKMDAFCQENGLKRCTAYHREIYLNNKNRTAPEKLKTILRYSVQ
ncbi:transcription activator effector binding domain-containing protein [Streptococcus anginosus 1_2_62CV]|uniref:GyrI-like domain-containing protein n=1 Tax=Streptococcus anginosus TaxID=1328 RepID=UPI0001F5FE9A|nr:GyrI-like domain-containing protein [Streptococcus anginosus]EFW08032.1 transcription activator effector binding domain-containing protein [Streptococcus anginosus 1_2_62CV]MCW1066426.1 GyrI-like domain-containing protein [Streptococcus anginosus]